MYAIDRDRRQHLGGMVDLVKFPQDRNHMLQIVGDEYRAVHRQDRANGQDYAGQDSGRATGFRHSPNELENVDAPSRDDGRTDDERRK